MAKYPKFLMEHFQNPRNVGEFLIRMGSGQSGMPPAATSCKSSSRQMATRSWRQNSKPSAVGQPSQPVQILTERIIGATLDEAMKISEETSKEVLAQLPKEKVPCFTLAIDALKLAIEEYRCKRTGLTKRAVFDLKEMERIRIGFRDLGFRDF